MAIDCSRTGSSLPACTVDFSNNQSSATVVTESGADVVQIQDVASPLATASSPNDGVKGNKGELGLKLLHGVALADFPGISFSMKLNTTDTTTLDGVYLNYTLSPQCDGDPGGWVNLVTTAANMQSAAGPDADGYTTYSAAPADVKWTRSGSAPYAPAGTILLNQAINGGGGPMSLEALIAAYPRACLFNWSNPSVGGVTPTPGVVIVLGDSRTVTDKKVWLKNIMVGTKSVF